MTLLRKDETAKAPTKMAASPLRYAQLVVALFVIALAVLLYQESDALNYLLNTTSPTPGQIAPDFSPDIPKRDAIVEAFKHAWSAYERDAMGDDEYHPISQRGSNLTSAGGIGYTVVDSIDTMLIMGLEDEYNRAREWIANTMSFDRGANFNTFETTIRVLGGLLAAYHLSSEDPIFLTRAVELGDRMLPVFDTPSGLPFSMVNLKHRGGADDGDNTGLVSTAEASTLQLEFKYLSHLTDNDEYWRRAEKVMKLIRDSRIPSGLSPIFMSPETGQFLVSEIRLGSRGDSYYEYLLKQYLQTGRTEYIYREMYEDAMQAIHENLLRKSLYGNLTYTAELLPERQPDGQINWKHSPKQDHLVCFLGGSLLLGATTTGAAIRPVSVPPVPRELSSEGWRDWNTGLELIETCLDTYKTKTGLSPEIAYFSVPEDDMGVDWYIKGASSSPRGAPPYDARYILRPETVESLFIAFRLTGDVKYRNHGWDIFQAIEKNCRVKTGGYASILDVNDTESKMEDKMETFLMSETLKYLYLLFSDASILPLDEYVFNTEAHPLPIFSPSMRTGFI